MGGVFYSDAVNNFKAAIKQQPVTIGVAANNKYIHSYNDGIIDADDCATTVMYEKEYLNQVNHGVLAVGYGHDKTTGLEYLLVKNSWNTTWGDSGFFKLKLVDDYEGTCGIFRNNSLYPVLN